MKKKFYNQHNEKITQVFMGIGEYGNPQRGGGED